MFATLVALTLAAPVAEEPKLSEAAKKDLKALEGKWKATAAMVNGEEPSAGTEVILEFKGRKLLVTEGDKKSQEFFEIATLDPGTTPKLIDFKALVDMGPITKGTTYEAIYKLDGDTLQLALYIGADKKRPEKFESPKDSGVVVITLKREKN
jgi:uncharacterized protein (TIGR03067 family)